MNRQTKKLTRFATHECRVETMRDEQNNNKVVVHGGTLDFLVKDPLRETYEGR
jgi:hypothetical protein